MRVVHLVETETTVTLALADRPVVRHPSFAPMLAGSVAIQYRDGRPFRATLSGSRLKGDGTPGKSAGTAQYFLGGSASEPAPVWLVRLAARYAPAEVPGGGWGGQVNPGAEQGFSRARGADRAV